MELLAFSKVFRKWKIMHYKLLLIMRLTAVFLLIASLHVSAGTFSQKVTIKGKDLSLAQVLDIVRKQTGYRFLYDDKLIERTSSVDMNLKDADLPVVLNTVLVQKGLRYEIIRKTIIITANTIKHDSDDPDNTSVPSPPQHITGTVKDENGRAVEGATVVLSGIDKGTSTDRNGLFTLYNISPGTYTLEVTSVGFEKVVRNIIVSNDKQPSIQILLKTAVNNLDETIVMGYGTTSRRTSTGSIAKVKGEELTRQNASNPLLALQGRAAGVAITNTSGGPGAYVKVQIRGKNSVAAGAEPLYIIDGVSMTSESLSKTSAGSVETLSPLNSINAADIESIEILKDADATAIYGSRGSNGVILITTKKAKAGRSKFGINFYSGSGKAATLMKMLNTQEYLKLRREAFEADGEDPTAGSAPDLTIWDQNAYTNWPRFLYGNAAPITNIQANLSGGDDKTRFLAGIGYYHQGSLLPGKETEDRVNAHFNVEHISADKRLTAGFTTNISSDHLSLLGRDIFGSYILPPNFPVYDANGELTYITSLENPYTTLNTRGLNHTNNVLASANLKYTLLPGLQLKVNAGYTQQQLKGNVRFPSISMNPLATNKNESRFSLSSYQSLSIEPQVDYSLKFDQSNLLIMAGATFQHNITEGNIVEGANFSTDLLLSDLSAAANISHKENFGTQYKYASVFSRVTYNYKGRYFLNGTFRRDGSSRFGINNRFGNFGALGAAWLLSSEDFVAETLPFLSYGKLRGSYGITGNDQISDYKYLETYTSPFFLYNDYPGLTPATTFNGEYGWEVNRKLEFALELGAFNNKILFTTAWFRNHCDNQLVEYPLASQSGFASYQANLPALLENKGWEFEITSRNIERKNFSWTSAANVSFIRNKLVKYPNLEYSPYSEIYVIGLPINLWWGYNVTGIDKETGLPVIQDVDGDGSISFSGDYVPLGSPDPRFFGGISNNFKYKGFELDLFFQFSEQKGYNWKWANYYAPGTMNNVPHLLLGKYWKEKGDNAAYPRLTASAASELYEMYSDYWFSNATYENIRYIRLKNIVLSWSLPSSWISNIKMQQCKLFVQGQNLLTLCNVKGLDPESAVTTPIMKTFTAGFQVSF